MRMSTVLITLTLSISAFGADAGGKWKANRKGPNGFMQITFDLKADREKVTGKAIGDMGEMPISDGTIDGDNSMEMVATRIGS